MTQTKAGGLNVRRVMIRKLGSAEAYSEYMRRLGAKGGARGTTGGFAFPLLCDCDYTEDLHKKASCAGALGGRRSKRRKKVTQ